LHALEPDMTALAELGRKTGYGVTIFCEGAADPECAIRVRSFAPHMGVPEDPVCGSGNGCVGAYRARRDQIDRARFHRAEQGIEVQRPGLVEVCVTPQSPSATLEVQVGGTCVTVLEGELLLPD
jgi:PhzF family phenazine biosynthesis protein